MHNLCVEEFCPPTYLALNNRHIFDRLFFYYTSLLFAAIVKTVTKNNASFSKKISALKNGDYLTLGTYNSPRSILLDIL